MSKIVAIALPARTTLFGRFLALIDQALRLPLVDTTG